MVVEVHFPRLEHNMEKVLTSTRQGIQCLNLSQNSESSGLCWLNDEVSCYYNCNVAKFFLEHSSYSGCSRERKHKLSLAPSASPRQQVTTKDISNSPSLSSMENLQVSHTLKHPPKPSNGSATPDSVQCSKTSGTSVQDLPSLHCSACNKRYKTKAGLYKHQRSKRR